MTVKELNAEQLDELRWRVFWDRHDGMHDTEETPEDISNETLFFLFGDITFTNDDFFCTAGKEVV